MNFGQQRQYMIMILKQGHTRQHGKPRFCRFASRKFLKLHDWYLQCNLRVKDALGLGFVLLREVVHWLEVTKLMYCWYTFGTTKSVL